MRIPLTRVWRAFPELDRFTDEQCARFVRAACKRGWGRHVHRALITLVTLLLWAVCFFGWIYAVDIADDGRWARRVPDVLVYFVAPVIAFSIPAVVMLVLKDFFLRRRIRYVIRARGTCPSCRYSLLGIVVSSGNIVICPECGIEVEADPSLNELTTDEQGRQRFTPTERIKVKWFWTPKRLRRLKRVAIVLAVFVFVVLPAGWGVYEVFLHRQAKTAQAERPGAAGVLAFVESHQEPGTTAADVNAFRVLVEIHVRMVLAAREVMARPEFAPDDYGMTAYADFSAIYLPPPEEESPERLAETQISRELAEALLVAYRETGVLDVIDSLSEVRRAVRPLTEQPDSPLIASAFPQLGHERELARINAARMHLALQAGDMDEFLAAMSANLAIARALRHQASFIEALAAYAIEAVTYDRLRFVFSDHPDGEMLDRLDAALRRQRVSLPRDHAVQGERLWELDTIAWFFTDPDRARLGRFSPELHQWMGAAVTDMTDYRLGTYAENRDASAANADALAEAALLDPSERALPPMVGDDLALLRLTLGAFNNPLGSADHLFARRRGITTMLALEQYRFTWGVYPFSLAELVPKQLAALPVDPWTGEPLRYRSVGDGIFAYVLYSVGPDGTDDGGKPDSAFDNWSNRNPDLILSPPRTN